MIETMTAIYYIIIFAMFLAVFQSQSGSVSAYSERRVRGNNHKFCFDSECEPIAYDDINL